MTSSPASVPHGHRVLVVGDIALDVDLELDLNAGRDEKRTVLAGKRLLGGTGANVAAAAARLGSRVALAGTVGTDPMGPWLAASVAEASLDASLVRAIEGRSTLAVILHDGGRRTVIVDRGVADNLSWFAGALLLDACTAASAVYLSGMSLGIAERVLATGHPRVIVGLEERQVAVGSEATRWRAVLDRAWAAIVNEACARSLGPCMTTVIETRGAAGAVIHSPGGIVRSVPARPTTAVDATGAGDAFAGAFVHFSGAVPILEAARLAAVAASLSVEAAGAQGGLPDEPAVMAAARLLLTHEVPA